MRFSFIHAEKVCFPVAALCRVLEVTRQGYYAYAKRPPSPRVSMEATLCESVQAVFLETGKRYGSPRVLRELQRRGHRVTLIAPAVFAGLAQSAGLSLAPLGTAEEFDRITNNPGIWMNFLNGG